MYLLEAIDEENSQLLEDTNMFMHQQELHVNELHTDTHENVTI